MKGLLIAALAAVLLAAGVLASIGADLGRGKPSELPTSEIQASRSDV